MKFGEWLRPRIDDAWASRGPRKLGSPVQHRAYVKGQAVSYTGATMYDLIIETGDVGVVTEVANGWVHADWPRAGSYGVPQQLVRPAVAKV